MFDAPTTTASLPLRLQTAALQQLDHAVGRAGPHRRYAQREAADVVGMEPVDILVRVDRLDDRLLVDVRRQWHLHEDPVDRVVRVQAFDQLGQLRLRGRGGQVVADRNDSAFLAGRALVADIDLGCVVVAYQDDRQARSPPSTGRELIRSLAYFAADVLGDLFSVDDRGGHGVGSKKGRHSVTRKRRFLDVARHQPRRSAQWPGEL